MARLNVLIAKRPSGLFVMFDESGKARHFSRSQREILGVACKMKVRAVNRASEAGRRIAALAGFTCEELDNRADSP